MRKNPYLRQEQVFRPLLMRGSFGNNFLTTSEQVQQELNLASEIQKKTYTRYATNNVSFDMIRPAILNLDGSTFPIKNIEMCSTECTQELLKAVGGKIVNLSGFQFGDYASKRPVEAISWYACIYFCNELSRLFGYKPYYDFEFPIGMDYLTFASMGEYEWWDEHRSFDPLELEVTILGGNGFRLPTEEEWLAFAKAGTNNRWSGTNVLNEARNYGWFRDSFGGVGTTHPVATKKPNEWGMYDMSGNVWEWVWDQEDINDTDPFPARVQLGGGFPNDFDSLDLSTRNSAHPRTRSYVVGFRFARTIE